MSQQEEELKFWKDLYSQHKDYIEFRKSEYHDKIKNFPSWKEQKGRGCDLGCGLISVLHDRTDKEWAGIDPLMDEYHKILPFEGYYFNWSGEDLSQLPDNSLDWVLCLNVIDHTPNPNKMADEIYRVLKPKGKLYFEVNYDDLLSPAHYGLWDRPTVDKVLEKFKLVNEFTERIEEHKQSRFWGEYQK